jgi:hypothetical protein
VSPKVSPEIRLVEIAELFGVTKQRGPPDRRGEGLPQATGPGRPWASVEPVRGAGLGQAVAEREALAAAGARPRRRTCGLDARDSASSEAVNLWAECHDLVEDRPD